MSGYAAEASLRAYEQGTEVDGSNYFDNYTLGCMCWSNLFNRLCSALEGDVFFEKKLFKKVLSISFQNNSEKITFYVSRVDKNERIPKAGKSIKLQLQEQFFLSEEIKYIIAKSKSTIFVLGYDIDIDGGLGKITFDMLSSTGKNQFQSTTIYTFNDFPSVQPMPVREAALVQRPSVTREKLPVNSKKGNG